MDKELEVLKRIIYNSNKEVVDDFEIIKQGLKEALRTEKILNIIIEKNVDIELIKKSNNWLDYYTRYKHRTGRNTELDDIEFYLIKGRVI